VNTADEIAAISDLYPAPGWPGNHGSIKGTIRFLTKILGNGTGPTQEISGVNIIARNLADPYNDVNSTTSGELTRGATGPDGSFEMHGLTPGATYGIYVDKFATGAFPTAPLNFLPGPEEWYNGANESGNGEADNRCASTGIPVSAGNTATADITFNRIKGAPSFITLPVIGEPDNLTADGSVVVGHSSQIPGYWTWSEAEGYQEIGGFGRAGGNPWISDDATKVAGNVEVPGNALLWGIYDRPSQTWTVLPTPDLNSYCPVSVAGFGTKFSFGFIFGLSADGLMPVGASYNNGPNSCGRSFATQWTAAGGPALLEKYPDPGHFLPDFSRVNKASSDGSILVGYDVTNVRMGVWWENGVEHFIGSVTDVANFVGEALFVTRDGTWMLGAGASSLTVPRGAWRYNRLTGVREYLHISAPQGPSSTAFRSNEAADVIGGFETVSGQVTPTVWTPSVGWMQLTSFLEAQGSYSPGARWGLIKSMSADGTTWATYQAGSGGFIPTIIYLPKAIVCHKSPGNPNAVAKNLDVTFPGGLDQHLAHGDTFGTCPQGGD